MKNIHLPRPVYFVKVLILAYSFGGYSNCFGQVSPDSPVLDLNHPDRFAWELFVSLNSAAGDDTNNNVMWENWASTEDIFSDPNVAPIWPNIGLETKKFQQPLLQQQAFREFMRRRLAPDQPQPEIHPSGIGGNEVRMNRSAFDYVVSNELYNIDGQENIFQTGKKVDFPIDAKEIKASWKEIEEDDKSRFHWQVYQGKIYGLIALHITTKDIPQWFWCTFEHMENPRMGAVVPSRDSFGLNPDGTLSIELERMFSGAGLGDHWKNYRLNGSQVDFTDLIGRPTILANSIVEKGFENMSSCLTCHARATIGPATGPGANRLSFFPPATGSPNPTWFVDESVSPIQKKYQQLDFVWSLFRAQRKTN